MTITESENTEGMRYPINPKPVIQVERVGADRVPIVIVDNVTLDNGESIRDQARSAQFEPEGEFMYPGIRAPLPVEYVLEVLQPAYQGLYQLYDIPPHRKLRPQQACFSLITVPEENLGLMQRIPHFDTPDPFFFAVLHYLGEGRHGETGFFQHLPTGFCYITEEREKPYFQSIKKYFETHGEPGCRYITGNSGQFRLYHKVEYKPDRMIIYPGNLIHSTLVKKDLDINPDPAIGRLTANIFIRYE